jgi:glucosylceramidase
MATQTWESCIYTAEEERDFVKNHLGPTLVRAGFKSKKLVIWDHNRDLMVHRASTVLNDPEAAKYVWGLGFHWYEGELYGNEQRVQEAFPKLNLIFTEACNYPWDFEKISEWHWGERYGKSMINDFNSGAVGWTDWNLLLDQTGGPNHVSNFCYAPIHGDTSTGRVHYMNSFYYIGHFSKFIRPGARRISCASMTTDLLSTAFQNTDGSIAVVVMNSTDKDLPFHLWQKRLAAKSECPAHSIQTIVLPGSRSAPLAAASTAANR